MFWRWPWLLMIVVSMASAAAASVASFHAGSGAVQGREPHILNGPIRHAQFTAVTRSRSRCTEIQPPEALTTPDPLLSPIERDRDVKISFIVGLDGRIHSPLILQSGGISGDRHVLQAIRSWRYRPATCNGVPTESEGKVEFSSH